MPKHKKEDAAALDDVLPLLQQALAWYKAAGPTSIDTLTGSFLAAPAASGAAEDDAARAMAAAFRRFDRATDSILKGFASRQGFDLSKSEDYRRRTEEGYFSNMYPVVLVYMIWLDRAGQGTALKNLEKIFSSAMFGVAGYGILDSNLDEGEGSPAEILLSLAFIQEHERLLLEAFEFDAADYDLLNRCKQLYLAAEIKEKRSRFVRSPYTRSHPEDCGYKAVHTFLPFALLLRRTGREHEIDEYLKFFYEWGAPLQIMDDLNDLEEDLKNGHYSYPTLGFEDVIAKRTPRLAAKIIRSDPEHLRQLHRRCKALIESAKKRSAVLGADLMGQFAAILEGRLDAFFLKEISGAEKSGGPRGRAGHASA